MVTSVLRIKGPSVKFDVINPAGFRILAALDRACQILDRDLLLTNGTEGHPAEDPHTSGEAFDVGVHELDSAMILRLYFWLAAELGPAFTVLLEVPSGMDVPPSLAVIAFPNSGATALHLHIQRKRGTTFPP